MLSYEARTTAPPEVAWPLMAEPRRWRRWAPHIRGAWGLGSPEVVPGARGAVRLLGALPVPARITGKRPGREWSWRVGPVELIHRVAPGPGGRGSVVGVDMTAAPPVEAALRVTYGPIVAGLVRNLARVAAREAERGGR